MIVKILNAIKFESHAKYAKDNTYAKKNQESKLFVLIISNGSKI
ncbi:hypothetical protein JCM11672_21980 [Alkaliphilus crotonatoxidans]